MNVSTYGLCIVSDQYFKDFPNIRHMSNKHESRPYYVAIRANNGIIWLVPLSTQVGKYRAKIFEDEKKYGESIFHYIARVKGQDNAFLIGNTIPVTEKYIKKAFTLNNVPFVIQDKADKKVIQHKLSRYLALVRCGKLKPAVDILDIERVLLNQVQNSAYIV